MDITQIILDDHADQRRLFAMIEQIEASNTDALGSIWNRLATLLELHADAEEELFYPELLKLGQGAGEKDDAEDETEDAIGDHNEIRDAVAEVSKHAVGSSQWFDAVDQVNIVNGNHMAEEEREGLTDVRRNVSMAERHRLAVAFAAFEAKHSAGVTPVDIDPQTYIQRHE